MNAVDRHSVTAAPPGDRERLATALHLAWGAIQLFDLRGLLTALSRYAREQAEGKSLFANSLHRRAHHARQATLACLLIDFSLKARRAEPTKVLFWDES